MWDNRAVQHRGEGYDYEKHRRNMVRATVAGDGPTITSEEAARREQAAAQVSGT